MPGPLDALTSAFQRARRPQPELEGQLGPVTQSVMPMLPGNILAGLKGVLGLGGEAAPALGQEAAQAASRSASDVFNPATARNMENMYHEAKPAFQGLEDAGAFGGDRSVGGLHQPGTGVMSGRPDLAAVGDEGLFNAMRPQAAGAADPVQSAYRALLQRGGR